MDCPHRNHPARLAIALIFFATPALAEPATVLRVVDGDTVWVRLQGAEVEVRLYGIDTPETHLCRGSRNERSCAKCAREQQLGLQAKAAARELLPAGREVQLGIATRQDERWHRLLATITIGVSDYGAIMKRRGLAAPYHGRGPKPDWCAGP